jgi:uncharacterized protein (DUF362 family)
MAETDRAQKPAGRAKTEVGLVKGDDRFENVLQAMKNAGKGLKEKIRGRVVVKINTVVGDELRANTHPDALRAVLQYLEPLELDRVVVGEASCQGLELFQRSGYLALADRYGVEFLDFNSTGYGGMDLMSMEGKPLPVRITKIHRDFDCLISLSVPKSHSDAVVTLSGKNMMGFLEYGEMWRIHGVRNFAAHLSESARVIHKNLRILLARVRPDAAVLDAFHSFQGGPVPQCGKGTYVEPRLAVAGADFVAVDTVAALALGFRPRDVGYLVYCVEDGYGTGDISQISVVGDRLEDVRYPLEPAPTFDLVQSWKD